MALYLRSLSTKVPAAICLVNAPTLLQKVEATHFQLVPSNPQTLEAGLYLPVVNNYNSNGNRILPQYFLGSRLPYFQSTFIPSQVTSMNSRTKLLTNPQPKPSQEDKTVPTSQKKNNDGRPTPDQLNRVYLMLQQELPNIFQRNLDLSLYSDNVVLVNNFYGKTYKGKPVYASQLMLLRVAGLVNFHNVRVELVSMSQDLKDGRVVVRWRIKGTPFWAYLKFWQYKPSRWREYGEQQETWHDGISYYDVSGTDGLIYKHTVDKVMEDRDRLGDERLSKKLRLLAKLKLGGASGASVH